MNIQQIYKNIRDIADPILIQHGFTSSGATYHKRISDELYHFILFVVSKDRTTYTIWAYPSTPRLNPPEWTNFPEQNGNPLGYKAFLNAKSGIGNGASRFSCRTKEALVESLSNHALPAVEQHAITFLEQFQTLLDIVPFLECSEWAKELS